MFRFNEIICETGLNLIQTLTHNCNIINEEHFEAIWSQTMYLCGIHNFANCVHRKGVTSFYAMTPIFDLHLVILNTLHWQLPFHSTLVTRRPYLGHDNWRLRYRFFSHYKVPLTFRYSWKRLRKRRSKNLIKFPQVYIAFVLQYVHCFEKKNTYWLNESWETRLPKRLKCTINYPLNSCISVELNCIECRSYTKTTTKQ